MAAQMCKSNCNFPRKLEPPALKDGEYSPKVNGMEEIFEVNVQDPLSLAVLIGVLGNVSSVDKTIDGFSWSIYFDKNVSQFSL
jgi:hypothetical protein